MGSQQLNLQARPKSAVSAGVAAAGLCTFVITVAVIWSWHPFRHVLGNAVLLMAVMAGAICSLDLLVQRHRLWASSGLDSVRGSVNLPRIATKLLGLLATLGLIGVLYWIFPEYHGDFYRQFFTLLEFALPLWLLAAIPYFYFIDGCMRDPEDGYYCMGKLALLQWSGIDHAQLKRHLGGWAVKGFFLPLMFVYLCNDLGWLQGLRSLNPASFKSIYDFGYGFFFFGSSRESVGKKWRLVMS